MECYVKICLDHFYISHVADTITPYNISHILQLLSAFVIDFSV